MIETDYAAMRGYASRSNQPALCGILFRTPSRLAHLDDREPPLLVVIVCGMLGFCIQVAVMLLPVFTKKPRSFESGGNHE